VSAAAARDPQHCTGILEIQHPSKQKIHVKKCRVKYMGGTKHAANSLIIEALAVRDGVQLAIDRNLISVEIETDVKAVLNRLEDSGGSKS
jgi:hypothetical protein